ncbi:hypothetical protein ACQPW1_08960 [Nocardia sp. CA-128927]|uniref:hypothetical protein n=1 Tax=Nocardia sp. CA-128927 TaxID=3239975 RepID=UPI003D95CDD5
MFETQVILDNRDLELPITFSASPASAIVIEELRKYQTHEIPDVDDNEESYRQYKEFLERALKPLGLYREEFLPATASLCYRVTYCDETAAIFRLTPVGDKSIYHRLIPGASRKRILEVNNVAVEPAYRGDLLLGIIMKNCALLSHTLGFEIVAGIVRYEVLPMFVDFGTVPVHHEAIHLLGDDTICDYITYFMTREQAHVDYALARSYHYFHRKVTMKNIQTDVESRQPRGTARIGA